MLQEQAEIKANTLELLDLDPTSFELGLVYAKSLLDAGQCQEALRHVSFMAIHAPGNPKIHLALATCALACEQFDLALHAASAAVALDPTNPSGLFFSARACASIGHNQEALEDLEHAMHLAKAQNDSQVFALCSELQSKLKGGVL